MNKTFKGALLAATLAVAGTAAGAATLPSEVTVSYQNDSSAYLPADGGETWLQYVNISTTADQGTGYARLAAGVLRLQAEAEGYVHSFNGFCIELGQALTLPRVYQTVTGSNGSTGGLISSTILTNVGKLFTNAYAQVKDSKTAAAFQLALWEIAHEKSDTLSLDSGNVRSLPDLWYPDSAEAVADGWLKQLGSWVDSGKFVGLVSADSQDLAGDLPTGDNEPAPVPLPASALLLGAGLSGLAALRRRKA